MRKTIVATCTLFVVLLVLCTKSTKAQDIVTEFWHENGYYYNFHNIVEANDGTLLVQCPLFVTPYGPDLGTIIYKVSVDGQLMDSVFFPLDDIPYRTLFEPVPNESGMYLYGRFENDEEENAAFLRMSFIDDNLNILNRISVKVEDDLYKSIITTSDLFIDHNNDIIAFYTCQKKCHMLRIGMDGTLKKRQKVDLYSGSLLIQPRHTGMYDYTAGKYYYMGMDISARSLLAFIIDTSFQVVEEHRYKSHPNGSFDGGFGEHIVPINEAAYLLSSRCRFDSTTLIDGFVGLTKFDRNHEILAMRVFAEGTSNIAPIWTVVMDDGTIYYSYMTDSGIYNRLVLVCLDEDLNIRWKRYFLEPDMYHWATCMTVLHDGKVAIGSYEYLSVPGSISVVVIQDNGWGTNEYDGIRPYAYYPNPARDELHLEYSPDITPTQIELFDLQGRLVKTQRNGLESLNLQGLAPGTYTMRVTLEDGKVFSDKVVKE